MADLPMHRYNQSLPPVYRERVAGEAALYRKAVLTLADLRSSDSEKDLHVPIDESYEQTKERELSALEKGLSKLLDLKFVLLPEDYAPLTRALLRGALTPSLEPGLRSKAARMVHILISKDECEIPGGIQWRAIVDAILREHVECINGAPFWGRDIREMHVRNFVSLLDKCVYFLPDGDNAKVIWDAFIGKIRKMEDDPDSAFLSFFLMAYVLPVRGKEWTGWTVEAKSLWASVHNYPNWDALWIALFAKVAKHQPATVNFDDCMPRIYKLLSLSLHLPFGSAAPNPPQKRGIPRHIFFLANADVVSSVAVFTAYSLSPVHPVARDYFDRIVVLIQNYCHPSNSGRWSHWIGNFLSTFISAIVDRVTNERAATKAGVTGRVLSDSKKDALAPLEHRLNGEYIDEMVSMLLPVLKQCLHSKSSAMARHALSSVRDLAAIAPHIVVKPILEIAQEGLEYIQSPHRTATALKVLASLTPIFLDADLFPAGANYLPQFLQLTLPGIDANDPAKTESTFRFISGASAKLHGILKENLVPGMDTFLEDYVPTLLERIFTLLSSIEAPPKKNRNGTLPSVSHLFFSVAMENLFAALPHSLVLSAAKRIARQVSSSATTNAMKQYGILLRVAARSAALVEGENGRNPSPDIFIPMLTRQLLDENVDSDDNKVAVLTSLSKDELVWRIRMLAQACRSVGRGFEAHLDDLNSIVRLAIERNERPIYKAGGRLLRGVLEGLTSIHVSSEPSSIKEVLNEAGEQEHEIKWHIPKTGDWQTALGIVEEFFHLAKSMVYGDSQGQESPTVLMNRETLFRALRLLHAVQRGARWLLGGVRPNIFDGLEIFKKGNDKMTKSQAMRSLKWPVGAGLGGEMDAASAKQAQKLWGQVYEVILNVLSTGLDQRPDDGALLYRCLEPIEMANEPLKNVVSSRRNETAAHHYKGMYRSVLALKRPYGAIGSAGRAMPHFIFRLRLAAMHDLRLTYAARPGANNTTLFNSILSKVAEYSLNLFPRVRFEARGTLIRSIRVAHTSAKMSLVKKFIRILGETAEDADAAQKSEQLTTSLASAESAATPVDGNGIAKMDVDADAGGAKPSSRDIPYEKMIGCSYVLRSPSLAPLIMRSVELYDMMMRILVKVVLSADRPDAALHVATLMSRLLCTCRPLTLDPVNFIDADLLTLPKVDETSMNSSYWEDRRNTLDELNNHLLGLVRKTPVSCGEATDVQSSQEDAHWKLQSLVASLLFVNLRKDKPPSFEVSTFFGKGVISDVVSMRQMSQKALMFILALHGKQPHPRLQPFTGYTFRTSEPRSAMNDAIRALDELISSKDYVKKLIHMVALDFESSGASSRGSDHSVTNGGFSSILSVVSHADAYSSWLLYSGELWPKSRIRRGADNISISRVRFYEYLLQIFGLKAFEAFRKPVSEIVDKVANEEQGIIAGVKDEDVRIIIGEIVTGICRGATVEELSNHNEYVDMTVDWALKVLDSLTGPQGMINGSTFIRLFATAEKGTVGEVVMGKVFNWLLAAKPLIPPVESTTVVQLQARRLRYLYYSVTDEISKRKSEIKRFVSETSSELTNSISFGHELKAVREEVARLLSLSAVFCEQNPDYGKCLDNAVHLLKTSRADSGMDKLSDDMARMEISESENEDSKEVVAKKLRSRLGETLSRKITLVYWGFPTLSYQAYLVKALPSLFVSLDDSDNSRVSHSRLALSLVAQGSYDNEHLAKVVSVAEDTTKAQQWRIRGGVLPFVQVLSLVYLFTGAVKELDRMRNIVVKLISDEQIEVRAGAAATFLPMIRDAPSETVTRIRETFLQVIKDTQPPRRRVGGRRPPMEHETIRRRHGATLGLSSFVISSPYSVPEWMPKVLVALSNCVNDPPPISTSVKKLFADFMRTHRDEWQMHKKAFTEDELDIVSELLVSPSYYA